MRVIINNHIDEISNFAILALEIHTTMPISECRISQKTANRLLQGVAVFYTLMNIAVVVLVSINGMEGEEPAPYIISHSLGILHPA